MLSKQHSECAHSAEESCILHFSTDTLAVLRAVQIYKLSKRYHFSYALYWLEIEWFEIYLAPYPIKIKKRNQVWKFRETIFPIEIQCENTPSFYISWVNMMNFFWKMSSKSFIVWPFVCWGDYLPQFCTLSMAVTVLNNESQVLSRGPVFAISFMHWYSLKL